VALVSKVGKKRGFKKLEWSGINFLPEGGNWIKGNLGDLTPGENPV